MYHLPKQIQTYVYVCVRIWQHEEAAFAAWLPEWWSHGSAWQQAPSQPENPQEPYHGQDEEDRHLLGQSLLMHCRARHIAYYTCQPEHGSLSVLLPHLSFHL